jgi:hypothetical protein
MSPVGTERTWRSSRCMSVIGATADDICSQRVFRLLTQLRHPDSADKPLSPETVRVPDLGVWSRRVVALDDLISIWNLEQTLLVIADPMLLPVKLGFGLLYNPLGVNS